MAEERVLYANMRSRRRLLGNLAGGAAVIGALAASRAAYAAQISQKSVAYQPTPKGGLACETCTLFEPPAACKTVEGKISPKGWCMIYAAKAS